MHSLVVCLSHLTIDHASLSRRSTVPTPRPTRGRSLRFFRMLHNQFPHLIPFMGFGGGNCRKRAAEKRRKSQVPRVEARRRFVALVSCENQCNMMPFKESSFLSFCCRRVRRRVRYFLPGARLDYKYKLLLNTGYAVFRLWFPWSLIILMNP